MSILSTIKGWFSMLLKSRAKDEFNITPIISAEVEQLIEYCARVYQGRPDWEDAENHIKTINMAQTISSEMARLVTLGIGIKFEGSARAKWLQEQVDKIYYELRKWVEYGCAYGTVILKPDGDTVKLYVPGQYEITEQNGGRITGVVFHNSAYDEQADKYYERLEYHRFENGVYVISNKCFSGSSPNGCNEPVDIKLTPWANLREEARILYVKKPLFAPLRTPHANNLDHSCPVTLPIFSDALEELRDLDVAYSRNAKEIEDSKRTVLLDSDTLLPSGGKVTNNPHNWEAQRESLGLPDMVKNVRGDGQKMFYQEINPTLNTEIRIKGINNLLSIIGFKSGFSNGHLVLDQKTGRMTAREVESDDARTIQTVKDHRDQLESCVKDLSYAMSKIADLYKLAPSGTYEIVFDFGDITYNRDEDRARYWGYVLAGRFPFWRFLVKYEGYTEKDAKEIEREAEQKTPTLFQ